LTPFQSGDLSTTRCEPRNCRRRCSFTSFITNQSTTTSSLHHLRLLSPIEHAYNVYMTYHHGLTLVTDTTRDLYARSRHHTSFGPAVCLYWWLYCTFIRYFTMSTNPCTYTWTLNCYCFHLSRISHSPNPYPPRSTLEVHVHVFFDVSWVLIGEMFDDEALSQWEG
jgi:hypothetical protein